MAVREYDAYEIVNRQNGQIRGAIPNYSYETFYCKESTADYLANGQNVIDKAENWETRKVHVVVTDC